MTQMASDIHRKVSTLERKFAALDYRNNTHESRRIGRRTPPCPATTADWNHGALIATHTVYTRRPGKPVHGDMWVVL